MPGDTDQDSKRYFESGCDSHPYDHGIVTRHRTITREVALLVKCSRLVGAAGIAGGQRLRPRFDRGCLVFSIRMP
jgi:hypothetical protein